MKSMFVGGQSCKAENDWRRACQHVTRTDSLLASGRHPTGNRGWNSHGWMVPCQRFHYHNSIQVDTMKGKESPSGPRSCPMQWVLQFRQPFVRRCCTGDGEDVCHTASQLGRTNSATCNLIIPDRDAGWTCRKWEVCTMTRMMASYSFEDIDRKFADQILAVDYWCIVSICRCRVPRVTNFNSGWQDGV